MSPTETEIQLAKLVARHPVPAECGPLETFTDAASVNGVPIRLAGIATELRGECVTGSAASLSEQPLFRAYMELIERLAIVEAMHGNDERFVLLDGSRRPSRTATREVVFPESSEPLTWRWARSNGVAVGATWEDATERARLELVERDGVLRSWYGESRPERVTIADSLVPDALRELYSFEAYLLSGSDPSRSVVGFFGIPHAGIVVPVLLGFAARTNLPGALDAAFSECLQPLGFLWGEELPTESPLPSPTPGFHQDYFLFPEHSDRLRAWLRGEHSLHRGILETASSIGEPLYVDLTPAHLTSRLSVAKAIPAGHVPLGFGRKHPLVRNDAPANLWVHPIA